MAARLLCQNQPKWARLLYFVLFNRSNKLWCLFVLIEICERERTTTKSNAIVCESDRSDKLKEIRICWWTLANTKKKKMQRARSLICGDGGEHSANCDIVSQLLRFVCLYLAQYYRNDAFSLLISSVCAIRVALAARSKVSACMWRILFWDDKID